MCYTSTALTLRSMLAMALVEWGGTGIRQEGMKQAPAHVGDAIVLPAGKLNAKYLFAAVTNEPRATPTLESIRASVYAVVQRAAGLELRSLALSLLRVRQHFSQDDLLFITLAPLVDHCTGVTSLRQIFLVLDEDVVSPWLMARLSGVLRVLTDLSKLRAIATALRDIEHVVARWDALSTLLLWDELRRVQLAHQQRVLEELKQSYERLGRHWSPSIDIEVDHCLQEIARIKYTLDALQTTEQRERQHGM